RIPVVAGSARARLSGASKSRRSTEASVHNAASCRIPVWRGHKMKRSNGFRGGLLGVGMLLALAALAPWTSRTGRAADPPAPGPKDNPALQAAAALYEGIRTETLPNGLRIYLKPIPGSPVVTAMVAYKVGSADENLDHTGLSHYLEHLM